MDHFIEWWYSTCIVLVTIPLLSSTQTNGYGASFLRSLVATGWTWFGDTGRVAKRTLANQAVECYCSG